MGIVYKLVLDEMDEETLKMLEKLLKEAEEAKRAKKLLTRSKKIKARKSNERAERLGATAASKVIEVVKLKIVINGHMHLGGYKTHIFPWGTLYIYISSDQRERHYLILNAENGKIEVWRDIEIVDIVDARNLLRSPKSRELEEHRSVRELVSA